MDRGGVLAIACNLRCVIMANVVSLDVGVLPFKGGNLANIDI
jgi:hypothetical protein